MDLGLAKELYFHELEGKTQQDTRIGGYVALLIAIAGALAFLIRIAWFGKTALCWISFGFSAISGVFWCLVIALILLGAKGIYEKIPSAERLQDYFQKVQIYYLENPEVKGNADLDFSEVLMHNFVSATTQNERTNLRRSARFYFANQLLPWALVSAAISGLCLAVNQFVITFFRYGG